MFFRTVYQLHVLVCICACVVLCFVVVTAGRAPDRSQYISVDRFCTPFDLSSPLILYPVKFVQWWPVGCNNVVQALG